MRERERGGEREREREREGGGGGGGGGGRDRQREWGRKWKKERQLCFTLCLYFSLCSVPDK